MHPELVPLYEAVYQKGDRSYWAELDEKMRPFEEPPIVVNYFFHEEIVPSAKKKGAGIISMSLNARRSANERE